MTKLPNAYWKKFHAGDRAGALAILEREASQKNNPQIMFLLGQEYGICGSPPIQDYGKAAQWFEKAAALGSAKAQYEFGLAQLIGLGIPPSPSAGLDNISLAANAGNALALRFLLSTENQMEHQFQLSQEQADYLFQLSKSVDMYDF